MQIVCVVILNYGTPELTINCANSALDEIQSFNGELVIVDNASPDDSFERLTEWRNALPDNAPVKLILAPENGGYASGNNLGLKSGDAEFYILTNSDTLIRSGAIAALVAEMRADPELGILGPQLLGPDGAPIISRFRRLTPLGEFIQATGVDFFYNLFRNHVVAVEDNEDDVEVEWIGFPCIMLRKTMIDDIGFLDEQYFMYFEDSAYCGRATRRGWKLGHCKSAVVQHFCGQSSKVEDRAASHARLPAYYYASRARFLISQYGRSGFVAANLLWYLGRVVNYLRVLALKPPKRACAARARDIWIGPDAHRQPIN